MSEFLDVDGINNHFPVTKHEILLYIKSGVFPNPEKKEENRSLWKYKTIRSWFSDLIDDLYLDKNSGVYLVECCGYFKIGISKNVMSRLVDMQIGNPFTLKIICVAPSDNPSALESKWHKKFGYLNIRGEWFKLGRNEVREIVEFSENNDGFVDWNIANIFMEK